MSEKAEAIRCRRFEYIVNEQYDFFDKSKMKGDFIPFLPLGGIWNVLKNKALQKWVVYEAKVAELRCKSGSVLIRKQVLKKNGRAYGGFT